MKTLKISEDDRWVDYWVAVHARQVRTVLHAHVVRTSVGNMRKTKTRYFIETENI